jgi:hypothetical protein
VPVQRGKFSVWPARKDVPSSRRWVILGTTSPYSPNLAEFPFPQMGGFGYNLRPAGRLSY